MCIELIWTLECGHTLEETVRCEGSKARGQVCKTIDGDSLKDDTGRRCPIPECRSNQSQTRESRVESQKPQGPSGAHNVPSASSSAKPHSTRKPVNTTKVSSGPSSVRMSANECRELVHANQSRDMVHVPGNTNRESSHQYTILTPENTSGQYDPRYANAYRGPSSVSPVSMPAQEAGHGHHTTRKAPATATRREPVVTKYKTVSSDGATKVDPRGVTVRSTGAQGSASRPRATTSRPPTPASRPRVTTNRPPTPASRLQSPTTAHHRSESNHARYTSVPQSQASGHSHASGSNSTSRHATQGSSGRRSTAETHSHRTSGRAPPPQTQQQNQYKQSKTRTMHMLSGKWINHDWQDPERR